MIPRPHLPKRANINSSHIVCRKPVCLLSPLFASSGCLRTPCRRLRPTICAFVCPRESLSFRRSGSCRHPFCGCTTPRCCSGNHFVEASAVILRLVYNLGGPTMTSPSAAAAAASALSTPFYELITPHPSFKTITTHNPITITMAYTTASTSASYNFLPASPSSPNAFALFSMTAQSPRENGYSSPYYELVRGNSRQSEGSAKSKKSLFGKIFGAL
jgi:hypothetical protein